MEIALSCGTSPIIGLRFSLHPMADNFVKVIKGAFEETDTTNVWMHTDDVRRSFAAKKFMYLMWQKQLCYMLQKQEHILHFNGTFSVGCPGDTAGDVYLDKG